MSYKTLKYFIKYVYLQLTRRSSFFNHLTARCKMYSLTAVCIYVALITLPLGVISGAVVWFCTSRYYIDREVVRVVRHYIPGGNKFEYVPRFAAKQLERDFDSGSAEIKEDLSSVSLQERLISPDGRLSWKNSRTIWTSRV